MLKTGDYFEYFGSIYRVTSASESSASITPVKEDIDGGHKLGTTNISRGSDVRILSSEEKDQYVRKDKDGNPIVYKKKEIVKKSRKATKREQELQDMINLQARKKANKKSRGTDLEEAKELNEEIEELKEKAKKQKPTKRKTTSAKPKRKKTTK